MAAAGLKPYYAVYSTFLQRSYDEIVIDICSQNLPVTLCIDRAGISGSDGETHQGVFDISFLSSVPNLAIAVPKDVKEFEAMVKFSAGYNAPLAIRYPREGVRVFRQQSEIVLGKWEILKKGDGKCAVIACGERAVSLALAASQILEEKNIAVKVINAMFVKPLDIAMIVSLSENRIVTI